ncbi:MAG: response regulator transcription factor [Oscillospiraceae bacterium]|nr:response regulator transcription factor [Oscillospiraceae bacterium]
MLSIAICDDEKNIRAYLSALIKRQGAECEITEYASADEYPKFSEHDLLFLDIEMNTDGGGDKNGMRLAERIRRGKSAKQPIIVFVTGYEKYVFDAFDVGAFQYLVKPINEQKFAEVFQRAVGCIFAETKKKALLVKFADEKRAVPVNDIYCIESRSHKIVLHMTDKKTEYYAKIGELEKELSDGFYRIHKGYLINLFHVTGYNKTEVIMTNGEKLPISRYKYDGFVKAYIDYISEGP